MILSTIEEIEARAKSMAGEHDLHSAGAVLIGVALLLFALKAGKSLVKLLLIVIAIALFAGAWWWHQHK